MSALKYVSEEKMNAGTESEVQCSGYLSMDGQDLLFFFDLPGSNIALMGHASGQLPTSFNRITR